MIGIITMASFNVLLVGGVALWLKSHDLGTAVQLKRKNV